MGAGLTVYNNDNKIQIDGAFRNLQLSRKITLSGAGETAGTFASGEVLAAVGGVASQSIDAYCINTPTGWRCIVGTFTVGMAVYVFSTNTSPGTHGAGLEVYDANGTIVYNSNDKHPIVVGFGNSEFTPASAAKPAIAVSENLKQEYHGYGYTHSTRTVLESKVVSHPAEYGWYDDVDWQFQWVTDMWGNQSYQMIQVPVRRYGIIRDSYSEIINEWVTYYDETPYWWTEWTYSNYRLSGGRIIKSTVSTGKSEIQWGAATTSTTEWYAGHSFDLKITTGSIVVDTRSWILFDVNGL